MSLLLEALKKAELAKQSAQPEQPPTPAQEMRLVEEPREPVITRESLPDISQPLEIRSEDFSRNPPADLAALQPAPLPDTREQQAPQSQPQVAETARNDAQPSRDAARQLFDVKEVDYNPRRPFYLTVAALVSAGLLYAVYVWWQMQPHYAVSTAAIQNAPKSAPAPVSAATQNGSPAAPAPQDAAKAEPPTAPVPSVAPKMLPAAEVKAAPPASTATPVFRPSRDATAAGARPSLPPAAARVTAATRPGEQPPITVTPSALQMDAALEGAYRAYQLGNLDSARAQYQRVLEREPSNRDALLGLAAIDARMGNVELAEMRYLKMLELNPRDTHAVAGLLLLQGGRDPVLAESRIKTLIASQPEATHLYFALGNQYAAQNRWPEAQEAYFRAYSANPENPDYAFNLAVSLERLRQPKLALEYYGRALALTAGQPAAFDRAQAEARVAELRR